MNSGVSINNRLAALVQLAALRICRGTERKAHGSCSSLADQVTQAAGGSTPTHYNMRIDPSPLQPPRTSFWLLVF